MRTIVESRCAIAALSLPAAAQRDLHAVVRPLTAESDSQAAQSC
jgi:hypothetical protein